MNYYEHHIGDYAEATAHLSFIEDAAYSRLIRKYYAMEKPLPADIKAVQRLIGARSKEEREAVGVVLEEFFNLQDDGWHNSRCDKEISHYREGDAEREQKAAHEKERMRRHREERMRLFAELRELGITPKWDAPVTQLRDMLKRTSNAPATRTGTEQERTSNAPATANHTPYTIHHTPEALLERASRAPEPEPEPVAYDPPAVTATDADVATDAGVVCRRLRAAGVTGCNPSHAKLHALLDAGISVEEIASVGDELTAKGKGMAWVLATVEGRRRDAAMVRPMPRASPVASLAERNRIASEEAKKLIFGVG